MGHRCPDPGGDEPFKSAEEINDNQGEVRAQLVQLVDTAELLPPLWHQVQATRLQVLEESSPMRANARRSVSRPSRGS